ncbi:unnamed protein product [Amoebophrya sp. A25]|nr:unnamed protein product [Amoebophrya sp. A25]|eukprot:GSA25T00002705001.1
MLMPGWIVYTAQHWHCFTLTSKKHRSPKAIPTPAHSNNLVHLDIPFPMNVHKIVQDAFAPRLFRTISPFWSHSKNDCDREG